MHKVLLIENDREVIASILRLLLALDVRSEVALSHPTAIQAYDPDVLKAVFISADMPVISANRLLAEFEDISARQGRSRPPVIFLYQRDEVVQQQKLTSVPASLCLKKPVSLVQLYQVLQNLQMTALDSSSLQQVNEKISRYSDFLKSSQTMLERLKHELNIT